MYGTMAAPQAMYAPANYSYAAPMVETMAAPQVAYAPQANYSYAAPMVETMAAPQVAYAPQANYSYPAPMAAPQVAYAPQANYSYAAPMVETMAAPQAYPYAAAMQQAIVAPQVPIAPVRLTDGIPTPEQIAAQRAGYSAALDKQLAEAVHTVQRETDIEKQMVKFTTEKTIALYAMSVEEKLVEQQALVDEQATINQLELKKALVERNLQLSAQAANLTMDYQMKAVQTELAMKQYQFQQTYMQAEGKLERDYMEQVAIANTGTAYAAPANAVR